MIVPGESTDLAPTPRRQSANLRPAWKKGQSGNPGGRAKGLNSYVRKQTKEGKELADFMLSILRRAGEFEGGRIPLQVRMEAATWLADRGFGKPVQPQEHSGPEGAPVQLEVRAVDYRQAAAALRPPPATEPEVIEAE